MLDFEVVSSLVLGFFLYAAVKVSLLLPVRKQIHLHENRNPAMPLRNLFDLCHLSLEELSPR